MVTYSPEGAESMGQGRSESGIRQHLHAATLSMETGQGRVMALPIGGEGKEKLFLGFEDPQYRSRLEEARGWVDLEVKFKSHQSLSKHFQRKDVPVNFVWFTA